MLPFEFDDVAGLVAAHGHEIDDAPSVLDTGWYATSSPASISRCVSPAMALSSVYPSPDEGGTECSPSTVVAFAAASRRVGKTRDVEGVSDGRVVGS